MNPVPSRQQPVFRALIFAVVLAAIWVYSLLFQGSWIGSLAATALDVVLSLFLLGICLFFYAQFTMPVRALRDRFRIWGRLLLHARNRHGAVVFVQNGRKVERRGESSRAGPGLLWIDTASAAVIRSETSSKQALGPGIHFISSRERVDSTFSLHTQTHAIGPGQDEPIFEKPPDGAGEEQQRRFASMQARRQAVSGLTRDGNEVIPEIKVVFRLDGSPSRPGMPGSRFGFRPESVERAAQSEGVHVDPVSARRSHVAWNQLPGLMAADLWREYLAKFTLDELFSARFEAVPEVLQPEEQILKSILPTALVMARRNWPARLLWRLNNSLEARLGKNGISDLGSVDDAQSNRQSTRSRRMIGREFTALQIIAHMVKARMTDAAVPQLDECGRYLKGRALSEEYRRLRERGLRILDVTLGGIRFDPAVERQIVQQWQSAWLANATSERDHVEQLEVLAVESGKQRALVDHARVLGAALRGGSPATIPAALRLLLQASHNEILMDERLHGRGSDELDSLAALTKWTESPDNE